MAKTTTGGVTLADGITVQIGEACFDYYSMKRGHFENMEARSGSSFDGWGDFLHDDGTRNLLNGERVCSLAHARSMGWLEEQRFENPADRVFGERSSDSGEEA